MSPYHSAGRVPQCSPAKPDRQRYRSRPRSRGVSQRRRRTHSNRNASNRGRNRQMRFFFSTTDGHNTVAVNGFPTITLRDVRAVFCAGSRPPSLTHLFEASENARLVRERRSFVVVGFTCTYYVSTRSYLKNKTKNYCYKRLYVRLKQRAKEKQTNIFYDFDSSSLVCPVDVYDITKKRIHFFFSRRIFLIPSDFHSREYNFISITIAPRIHSCG